MADLARNAACRRISKILMRVKDAKGDSGVTCVAADNPSAE
jgi:hypothetical protein